MRSEASGIRRQLCENATRFSVSRKGLESTNLINDAILHLSYAIVLNAAETSEGEFTVIA